MKVRAWYGLPGDIEVDNELWHLVRVAGMSLPHRRWSIWSCGEACRALTVCG